MWYPEHKQELESFIDNSFKKKPNIKSKKIHGLIVPHAGYEYSGEIAGKAFSLLKNKRLDKAVIIGPSHYAPLNRAVTSDKFEWVTPLGKIKLFNTGFQTSNIEQEHSIKNQIPFLQKLNIKEIIPIMVGKITDEQAKELAKKIAKIKAFYIFSTDLSHFYEYDKAKETDKNTIKIIENLDKDNFKYIDACGQYPLMIMMHLCKIKKTHPHLIEYKNSGDIVGDKSAVVGYASFWF
ncbi:MAG: AmmeMemoRadiSam system protein B [Nanoarchaeota archaeon]